MKTRQTLLLAALVSTLCGCAGTSATGGSAANSGPSKIIRYSEHQKQLLEQNGTVTMNIAVDALQKLNLMAYVGSDFDDDQEDVWIEGKPFTGLQVTMQGPAFQQNFLGPPHHCDVKVEDEAGGKELQRATATFQPVGPGSFIAKFPTLTAQGVVSFNLVVPTIQNGVTQFTVMVTAMKGDAAPYSIERTMAIHPNPIPAQNDSPQINEPQGADAPSASGNFVKQGGIGTPQGDLGASTAPESSPGSDDQ